MQSQAYALETLEVRYEPIVDAGSGSAVALQAVLATPKRGFAAQPPHTWRHRHWQMAYGDACVDHYVLSLACANLKSWQEAGLQIPVCVPVSLDSFARPGMASGWLDVMTIEGVDPALIEFGFTPLSARCDQSVLDNMRVLSKRGASFSQLSFGVAYSSMALLKRLPVSRVESDASFVSDVLTDRDDAAILQSTSAMVNSLKLKLCAEAVDSKELADKVTTLGCQQYRGLAVSHPLASSEVALWIGHNVAFPFALNEGTPARGVWAALLKRLRGGQFDAHQ